MAKNERVEAGWPQDSFLKVEPWGLIKTAPLESTVQ